MTNHCFPYPQRGLLTQPRIFFNSVTSSLKTSLGKIVASHGGEVVHDVSLATHIIDWNPEVDSLPKDLDEDYIRVLDTKHEGGKNEILVHWWYYPDSYDQWIASEEVDDAEPVDLSYLDAKKQWTVSCRFISDCSKFNEWCNELDYEIAVESDNQDVQRVVDTTSRKGRKKMILLHEKVASKELPVPESCTLPKLMVSYGSPDGEFNATIVEVGETSAVTKAYDSVIPKSSEETLKRAVDDLVPTVATPYKLGEMSEVESKLVKDLPIGRNIITYLEVRDSILRLNEQLPNQYLSATDCRRKLNGDAGLILAVHEFLNMNGFINCGLDDEKRRLYSHYNAIYPLLSDSSLPPAIKKQKTSSESSGNEEVLAEIHQTINSYLKVRLQTIENKVCTVLANTVDCFVRRSQEMLFINDLLFQDI